MIILAAMHQAGLLINTRPWWLPPTVRQPVWLSGHGDGVVHLPRGACGCNTHTHTLVEFRCMSTLKYVQQLSTQSH